MLSLCCRQYTESLLTYFITRMHSSRMCTTRSSSRPQGFSTRHSPQSRPPGSRHPPQEQAAPHPLGAGTFSEQAHTPPLWTEWQTGAKILPCPKLRLRVVKMRLLQAVLIVPELLNIDVNEKCCFLRKRFTRCSRVLVATELVVSGTQCNKTAAIAQI